MTADSPKGNRSRVPRVGPVVINIVALVVAIALVAGCSTDSTKNHATATTSASNALLNTALKDLNDSNYGLALSEFEAVAKAHPHNKYAFYDIGYIDQIQGRGAEAETQYQLTLNLDSSYEPALYNLGILRAAAGQTTDAIALYQRAISSNRLDANAHFNLGLLLRQTGKTAAGNSQVQIAVGLSPSLARAAAAQGVPAPAR